MCTYARTTSNAAFVEVLGRYGIPLNIHGCSKTCSTKAVHHSMLLRESCFAQSTWSGPHHRLHSWKVWDADKLRGLTRLQHVLQDPATLPHPIHHVCELENLDGCSMRCTAPPPTLPNPARQSSTSCTTCHCHYAVQMSAFQHNVLQI